MHEKNEKLKVLERRNLGCFNGLRIWESMKGMRKSGVLERTEKSGVRNLGCLQGLIEWDEKFDSGVLERTEKSGVRIWG